VSAAPLRVGVVGVGNHGSRHARLYAEVNGARLVGVYDIRPERGEAVARECGTTALPSLEGLLDAVDAVSVVVPTSAHAAVALAAVARGRHVLVEKPLTATTAEAERLVEAAEAAGVVLQVGHVERFNRVLRAAAPYLGTPVYVESDRVAPFHPRNLDVAVVLDLMIHDLDLVLTLIREPVVDVRASGIAVVSPHIDIATARIEFASGAVANLTASRLARDRVRRLRIFQPAGYFSLDLAAGTGEYIRLRPGAAAALTAGTVDLLAAIEQVRLKAPDAQPLLLELQSFVDTVRTGGVPAVTGRDGLAAVALAARVLGAMRQHQGS
jgi:predicted dehydrogenase